jgi:hypothetical protein
MNWKSSLSRAAVVSVVVICSIWQARSEGTGEAVAPEKQDTGIRIESAMGKGFGTLFAQEVLLEKVYLRVDNGNPKPRWFAKAPGASSHVSVMGDTPELQKKIEDWVKDHPGKIVKVAAYETIRVVGGPPLPIGEDRSIDGVPIESESGARPGGLGVVPELVIVGFAKEKADGR